MVSIDGWMDGWMDGWIDDRTHYRSNGSTGLDVRRRHVHVTHTHTHTLSLSLSDGSMDRSIAVRDRPAHPSRRRQRKCFSLFAARDVWRLSMELWMGWWVG